MAGVSLAVFKLTLAIFLAVTPTALAASTPPTFDWGSISSSEELSWQECYNDFQCTKLKVPLNYSSPISDTNTASIAILRRQANVSSSSQEYKGPILFNPGGPGESGVDEVLRIGEQMSTILGEFDLVGFDPRGIARSTPKASYFNDVQRAAFTPLSGLSITNQTDEGVGRTWAGAQILGKLAGERGKGFLEHLTTPNTARDMRSILKAYGQDKLQYWGISYGSVLGATYAAMFPDKIERMIIDGVADSDDYFSGSGAIDLVDAEKVMESFYTGCAKAGPENCPFHASDAATIRSNLEALYEKLRTQPVPVVTSDAIAIIDHAFVRIAVWTALHYPFDLFKPLSAGLAALAAGDGSIMFSLFGAPSAELFCDAKAHTDDVVFEGTFTLVCNDYVPFSNDINDSKKALEEMAKVSQFADTWAQLRIGCSGWPKIPRNDFRGPWTGNTSHPILVIGNTADPATPMVSAKKMSSGFPNSVLLTQNSFGHTSMVEPSTCTYKVVREYFTSGALPAPGTICQPDFDTPFRPDDAAEQTKRSLSAEDVQIREVASQLSANFAKRRHLSPLSLGL